MFTVYCSGCLGDQLPSFCHSHGRRRRSVWPLSCWQAGKLEWDSSMQLPHHDGKNWFGHSNLSVRSADAGVFQVFSWPSIANTSGLVVFSAEVWVRSLLSAAAGLRDVAEQRPRLGRNLCVCLVVAKSLAIFALKFFWPIGENQQQISLKQQTGHVHCIRHWPQAMAHCGFCFSAACWCSARTVEIVAWFEQNASGIPRSKVVVR